MRHLHNLTESAPAMLSVIEPRFAHALRKAAATLAGATSGELHGAAIRLQRALAGAP